MFEYFGIAFVDFMLKGESLPIYSSQTNMKRAIK